MDTTRGMVLRFLIENQDYVSGELISDKLGISRAAVWKAVDALRSSGYGIESSTRKGYRLTVMSDILTEESVGALLKPESGIRLICLDRVDSTNNYAKNLATSGAADGTVVIANHQTGGRGRMGRSFYSPSDKGIYLSYILRPRLPASELSTLTARAAVAVCDAIEETSGFRPGIKWVNDIVCDVGKLCGILTELSIEGESGEVSFAVVGIGINVGQEERDFADELSGIAASIRMACGKQISRPLLAARLIDRLKSVLDDETLEGRAEIMARYRAGCVTVGKDVMVIRGDSSRPGSALSIEDDAALVVRFEDGHIERINAGEVTIRPKNKGINTD